jgi:GNAT superfamily N-acetyltransferase
MADLTFELARTGRTQADWRRIHNLIIPWSPLSAEEVAERAGRNRLEVAYHDGEAVGCSTVRLPEGDPPAVVVIARILPGYRNRGWGTALYERARAEAAAGIIETIVHEGNEAGLRFAVGRGFAEVERADDGFILLRRA